MATTQKHPPRPKPIEHAPLRLTAHKCRDREGQVQWTWRARLTGEDGKRKNVTLKHAETGSRWFGPKEKVAVRAAAAALLADGLPSSSRSESWEVRTLGDLLDLWVDHQRSRSDISPKTFDHYDLCARHLVGKLRDVLIDRVDGGTLEGYREARLREKASPRLVLQELKILAQLWRWGRQRDYVPLRDFPCVRVNIDPTKFVIEHRTPSVDEVAKVLGALDGESRLVVLLLATTGARVSEVCSLRRCDLDPRNGRLTLDGKTGTRLFPLPGHVAAKVLGRADGSEALLLDLPPHADQCVRSTLNRACKRAGVPRFTPHGLRRMVVDTMVRSGVEVATAAKLTGHSVEVMLRLYRQVSDEDRVLAVAAAKLGHFGQGGDVLQGPWPAKTGT